jgi:amino acid transporter
MEQKLGFYETLAVCIGAIMTTAIFTLPAIIYLDAGYSSIFIWVAAGVIAVIMGLCFAELSGMVAQSGGPFAYVRKAFGDFPAFVTGWSMWLYSVAAISMLAIITSNYVSYFMPFAWWQKVLLSIGILGGFTALNSRGVKSGARAEVAMIIMAVLTFLIFIFAGLPNVDTGRFAQVFAGFSGVLLILAMEPFIGWETPIVISEEVKNPRKTLPKAILVTTLFTAALNMLLVFVFLGSAEPSSAAGINPVANTAEMFIPGLAAFFSVSAIVIGISALNSWILAVARLPAAMAKRKLFLLSFARTNKSGAPVRSLLLQFGLASALCFVGNVEHVVGLLLAIAFVMYAITFTALLRLREMGEGRERVLKLPIVLPAAGVVLSVALLAFTDMNTLLVSAVLLLSGVPAFVMVKLLTDKKFIEKYWDRISFIWQFYWPVFVYRQSRIERVIRAAQLRDGQTILDHGAGAGATTVEISKKFPTARIVADDISRKQIGRAVKTFKDLPSLSNVIFVKTKGGVPYPKTAFDRIVCVLAINYFVKPEKDLAQLHKVLKRGGRAVFLAVRAPGIISHTFLNTDQGIRSVFGGAGFRGISVERERRFLREYIYITAAK